MKLRGRFFAELAAAVGFAIVLFATFIAPDWIELVFGIEPDQGGGEIEWGAAVVVGLIAVACSMLARIEWRKARRLGNEATNV